MGALAALYQNIFRNPHRSSAKIDFEHFRAGKAHLERDLGKNSLRPILTKLFTDMEEAAEDLLSRK